MSAEIVFQAGGIIFAIASVMFLFTGTKKPNTMTEFFISFITTTSYAVMSLGIATTTSAGGALIYWSRWLFYMAACSLLMYDTADALGISQAEYPKMAIFTGLTMFNGFLASYLVTEWRWIFFVLSSAAYLGLLSFELLPLRDARGRPEAHPLFTVIEGDVGAWETSYWRERREARLGEK